MGFPTDNSKNHNFRMFKLEEWKNAQAALAIAKANEAALRSEIVALFSEHSGANDMHKGTETVETGMGNLKIVHKINYAVSDNDDALDKALDAIEKSHEGGNVIADRLIKYKPELSVAEYNLLTPAQRAIIDRVLTAKPASKEVKLVPVVGA